MKQYTIAVPDDKDALFHAFIKKAGILLIESDEIHIPKWHADIIKERLAIISEENMLDWDDVKRDLANDL